jgi:type IV secretion system protein TrbF
MINNDDTENPYFNNRKDWNEIYGKEKANAAMWRMFGLISMLITVIAVCGIIYASQLPDVVPFLFKEDGSGGITALGVPNTALKVDNRVIANQLATFVEDLRQVPSAEEIRRTYVHRVKMMSTQSLFRNQLAPMLKDEYATIGTGSLNIQITTVFPVSKDTWEIDWTEYKNGTQSGKYKGTLNYTRNSLQVKDPSELIWNPLGIIVKDISINPVIGS